MRKKEQKVSSSFLIHSSISRVSTPCIQSLATGAARIVTTGSQRIQLGGEENPVGQCWSMPKALITRKRFKPRTMGASAVAVAAGAAAAAVVAIGSD
ncbi:hypothetical protein F4815DRAFT_444552 [Daldinia loculata]|nr:hypothetical protein F4815DRAFT_444552 [Daldinia loculata]